MSAIKDFEELKNSDPKFAIEIKKAVDKLDNYGVFEYLREYSDRKLNIQMELKPDINGLVVTAAKHAGFVEALDAIMSVVDITVPNTLSLVGKYGVSKEELK